MNEELIVKIHKFIKDWEIKWDENEVFNKFKNRVLNFFSCTDYLLSGKEIKLFCFIMGLEEEWHFEDLGGNNVRVGTHIIDSLRKGVRKDQFCYILQSFFWSLSDTYDYFREIELPKFIEILNISNINLYIREENNQIQLFSFNMDYYA